MVGRAKTVGWLWTFWEGWPSKSQEVCAVGAPVVKGEPPASVHLFLQKLFTPLGLQQSVCPQCADRNDGNRGKDGDISLRQAQH